MAFVRRSLLPLSLLHAVPADEVMEEAKRLDAIPNFFQTTFAAFCVMGTMRSLSEAPPSLKVSKRANAPLESGIVRAWPALRTNEIFVFFEAGFYFVYALCTRIKALVAYTHRDHSTYSMSAFPPKADMYSATQHVRFVPIADIAPLQEAGCRFAILLSSITSFLTLLQYWSGVVMCPACLCGPV